MTAKQPLSKNYVFREGGNSEIEFVGDFDTFYREVPDPWEQSAGRSEMGDTYRRVRGKLALVLGELAADIDKPEILEVGCGLGHALKDITSQIGSDAQITGADVSPTAIRKAEKFYPEFDFTVMDITQEVSLDKKFNIEVFNQVLWYLVHRIDHAYENAYSLLEKNGYLVTNALFPVNQRYGRDVIDGFDGLLGYFYTTWRQHFRVVKADIEYRDGADSNHGIIVLQKI